MVSVNKYKCIKIYTTTCGRKNNYLWPYNTYNVPKHFQKGCSFHKFCEVSISITQSDKHHCTCLEDSKDIDVITIDNLTISYSSRTFAHVITKFGTLFV